MQRTNRGMESYDVEGRKSAKSCRCHMSLPPLHALFRKRTLIDGAPGKAATDATGVTESITVNACTFTRMIGGWMGVWNDILSSMPHSGRSWSYGVCDFVSK